MMRGDPPTEEALEKALRPLGVMIFIVPLLNIAVSIPLALGMVGPNGGYGYRTPAAYSSPEAWYALNTAAGWCGIVGSLIAAVAGFLILKSGRGGALARYGAAFGAVILLVLGGIAMTPLVAG